MKEMRVFKTLQAKLTLQGNGPLPEIVERALAQAITENGVANQKLLELLVSGLKIQEDSQGVFRLADLVVPCGIDDVDRAMKNIAKPVSEPKNDTPRSKAEPRYQNSYRLIECFEGEEGKRYLRFRIAERFVWTNPAGKALFAVTRIDAKFFQGLIRSWVRPDLSRVPAGMRGGVCQKAAEQLLSFVGLCAGEEQENNSSPSVEERHPTAKSFDWHQAVENVSRNTKGFQKIPLRDAKPGEYDADDRTGDRLIVVDPDWNRFLASPFPERLPATFVESDTCVLFRRSWSQEGHPEKKIERVYVFIPLFEGVAEKSPLHQIVSEHGRKLSWWQRHREEFTPLPAFAGAVLPKENTGVMVPLGYDEPVRPSKLTGKQKSSHFLDPFYQADRKVCWSMLSEKRNAHPQKKGKKRELISRPAEWYIQLVTAIERTPVLRPLTLGIHFQPDPVISWSLANEKGEVLERGLIEGNEILSKGLAEKAAMEDDQKAQRWVGGKQFMKELKRRSMQVAGAIVRLAFEKKANLAIESITRVPKAGKSAESNVRFSMWNYSELPGIISWMALDRFNPAIITVAEVNDFVTKFTCPACGTRRKAGEIPAEASVRREGSALICQCGFHGSPLPAHYADVVAKEGSIRTAALAKKEAERSKEKE